MQGFLFRKNPKRIMYSRMFMIQCFFFFGISSRVVQAQIPSNFPSTPVPIEPEIKPQLPPPNQLIPTPIPSPPQPSEIPADAPQNIIVKQFNFVGNTVFSEETLTEVTQSYLNRPLSFSELLAARSAITQLYVERGYVTSGAYIPPQEIDDNVVTIAILEGVLEDIIIEGKGRLNADYVKSRLAYNIGTPLNINEILEALQVLQLNPLIETISGNLAAGVEAGTSRLEVQFVTADTFKTEAILDNGRSPTVGSFRRSIQLEEANITGWGDKLDFAYRNTDGSDDIDFSYTVPFNPLDGTIRLGYRTIESKVIESPLDQIDLTSDYRRYNATLRQPIWQTPEQEFVLGLSFERTENETFIRGFPFPVSLGADANGKTRVSSLRFFQEWLARSETDVILARSQFSLGIEAFEVTVNPEPPDSNFFDWRGQAQWVHLFAADTLLIVRGDLQFSDRPLVSVEQFALGGLGSVRGYRQNILLTDNGFFGSIEARLPIYRDEVGESVLQITPFFDVGVGWNHEDLITFQTNTLASVGIGLQYTWDDKFSARLDWGISLTDVDNEKRTLQDNGIHFTIIFRPF